MNSKCLSMAKKHKKNQLNEIEMFLNPTLRFQQFVKCIKMNKTAHNKKNWQ